MMKSNLLTGIVMDRWLTFVMLMSFFFVPLANAQLDQYSWLIGKDGITYRETSTIDSEGNVLVSGTFYHTLDCDPGPDQYNLSTSSQSSISCSFIQKVNGRGELLWAKPWCSNDRIIFYGLTTDADGNILATGMFEGTVDFDPGNSVYNLTSLYYSDIFIMKLDKFGNFQWVVGMGCNTFDSGDQIKVDAFGNVYVSGFFDNTVDFDPGNGTIIMSPYRNQQCFLLKMSTAGTVLWARRMAGDFKVKSEIELDAQSNIYFCSQFSDTVIVNGNDTLVSNGHTDISIEKLDSDGNLIWVKSIGGQGTENLLDLALDASQNIYLSGTFNDTVDVDPNPQTSHELVSNSYECFLLKLRNNADFVTVKTFSGNEKLGLKSTCINQQQRLFVAAQYTYPVTVNFSIDSNVVFVPQGSSDVLMIQMDTSLNVEKAISFGGTETDYVDFIFSSDSTNCYLHGESYSDLHFYAGNGDYLLGDMSNYYLLKMGDGIGNDYRNDFEISCTPNPTTGIVYVRKDYLSQTAVLDSEIKVIVYDFVGKPILEISSMDEMVVLDLTGFASGAYFITVGYDGKIFKSKCTRL